MLQEYFKIVKNKKTANELEKVTDIFEVINQQVRQVLISKRFHQYYNFVTLYENLLTSWLLLEYNTVEMKKATFSFNKNKIFYKEEFFVWRA